MIFIHPGEFCPLQRGHLGHCFPVPGDAVFGQSIFWSSFWELPLQPDYLRNRVTSSLFFVIKNRLLSFVTQLIPYICLQTTLTALKIKSTPKEEDLPPVSMCREWIRALTASPGGVMALLKHASQEARCYGCWRQPSHAPMSWVLSCPLCR